MGELVLHPFMRVRRWFEWLAPRVAARTQLAAITAFAGEAQVFGAEEQAASVLTAVHITAAHIRQAAIDAGATTRVLAYGGHAIS